MEYDSLGKGILNYLANQRNKKGSFYLNKLYKGLKDQNVEYSGDRINAFFWSLDKEGIGKVEATPTKRVVKFRFNFPDKATWARKELGKKPQRKMAAPKKDFALSTSSLVTFVHPVGDHSVISLSMPRGLKLTELNKVLQQAKESLLEIGAIK